MRPMKLPKIASPTPSHPAGEDTRPGGQLAAKAGPGTHHAAKIRAEDPWARYQVYEIKIKWIYDLTRDATMQ
jgi:hypothetical protein